MVAFRMDASQYEASMGGSPVQPEGWYTAIIAKSEIVKTKDETKNNHMLVLTFQLQNGQTYLERYNVMNDNADTVRIAMQALSFIRGVLRLAPQMNDTNELHNIPLQIWLSVEEDDINGRKIQRNRMRNARFADGTDYKPGKVPAPNPATQNPSQAGHYAPPNPQAQTPQQGGGFTQPGGPGPQGGGFLQQPQQSGFPQPGQPQPQGGFAPPPQGGFAPPQGQAPQPGFPQPGFPQPGQPAQGFAPPQGGQGFPQPGQAAPQQPQGGFPQQGGFSQPGGPAPQQSGFPPAGAFPQPGFPQQ